jgi:leucyl aminopeptidase (aminopeptidase T)
VEGTAQGKLVVPAGWYPDLVENMTLTFEAGYVVAVEGGGEVGKGFIETFHFGDDTFKHRRNCAELGIGTNPNASRTDSVLEAEKIKGTVHIAVGDNFHIGGRTESDLHTDFILCQPALVIDGQRLIG